MAVTAATYAIGSGVDSITLARAGAADASGTLMLFVVSCISDVAAAPFPAGDTAQWAVYSTNLMASYGHYATVSAYARFGTASEPDTTLVYKPVGATVAKTVFSAVMYRISDPLSTTSLVDNRGARNGISNTNSVIYNWPNITLIGNGSVLIDAGAMLANSSANAASLKLRGDDTETVIHKAQETDVGAYWLAAAHGYRNSQTGVLPTFARVVTGNLGGRSMAIEVRQSASSGGGPPLPPFATVGKTMYIGV
jgi:hypothetical protein